MAKANMQTINVNRAYETREKSAIGAARIGQVEAVFEIGNVTINGQPVAPAGVEHLLNFAFQTLQDAYAGAESEADAREAFNGKLERIIAGTIGVRAAGDGQSALRAAIRSYMREDVKKIIIERDGKNAWKDMEESDRVAEIDNIFSIQDDDTKSAITAGAMAEMEEARIARERKAASKAGLVIKPMKLA